MPPRKHPEGVVHFSHQFRRKAKDEQKALVAVAIEGDFANQEVKAKLFDQIDPDVVAPLLQAITTDSLADALQSMPSSQHCAQRRHCGRCERCFNELLNVTRHLVECIELQSRADHFVNLARAIIERHESRAGAPCA